jgi:hypothetical protein
MNKLKLLQPFVELCREKNFRIYVLGFLVIVLVCILGTSFTQTSKPVHESADSFDSPDTVIPKGFVLVPVELQNAESLSAMVDQFAVVDLYVPGADSQGFESAGRRSRSGGSKTGRRIGYHLKLLRAPLNPKTFAVLVPEAQAPAVVSTSGALFAVIQNPKLAGQGQIDKPVLHAQSRVQYYRGSQP